MSRQTPPYSSPFEPLVPAESLPPVVARQFFTQPGQSVTLEGTMDRIWWGGFLLWPMLWTLGRLGMLPPETGEDVPATLVVKGVRTADGRPAQVWRRTFRFPRKRRFVTFATYDERARRVVDSVGPGKLFQVLWSVSVEEPGRVVLQGAGWRLRLASLRLPLPGFLFGTARGVLTAGPAAGDELHLRFSQVHPLLGPMFGYEGRFRAID